MSPRRADDDAAHQEPEHGASEGDGEQGRRVDDQLAAGDPGRQVVDGVPAAPTARRATRRWSPPPRRGRTRTAAGSGAGRAGDVGPPRTSMESITGGRAGGPVPWYRIARMRALYIIVPILAILVLAYRYYSAFIAAKILVLDDCAPDARPPRYDGQNFYPTTRWVLFGHHFAAITGAGPLVGPVLAAQFGYAPGLPLARGRRRARRSGARHDHPVGLDARAAAARSPRSRATKSAAWPASRPASRSSSSSSSRSPAWPRRGQRPGESAWGTFTIGCHDPAWRCSWASTCTASARARIGRRPMHRRHRCCSARVVFGKPLASSAAGCDVRPDPSAARRWPSAVYGFFASVLPGVAAAGAARLPERVHEDRHDRAARRRRDHRQPRAPDAGAHPVHRRRRAHHPGPLFPFVFITIACGAISGLPRPDRLGHHAQDDRPRSLTSGRSATAPC